MNRLLAIASSYSEYYSSANHYEFAEPMAKVNTLGNSVYHVMIMFASFAGVIVLLLVSVKMMVGNSKEKATSKDKIISTACIMLAIFSLATLINELTGIVSGFTFW